MRTFYRKSNLTDIWHFCRECENWPLRYYEETVDPPVIGFCLSCIQQHRDERCQSAHLEVLPGWLKIFKRQAEFLEPLLVAVSAEPKSI
jgi:hypothetical protein